MSSSFRNQRYVHSSLIIIDYAKLFSNNGDNDTSTYGRLTPSLLGCLTCVRVPPPLLDPPFRVPGFEYWVPDSVHVWRKVSCLSVLHDGQGGQVVVRDCEQVERIDTLPLPSLLPPSPANDKVLSCFRLQLMPRRLIFCM